MNIPCSHLCVQKGLGDGKGAILMLLIYTEEWQTINKTRIIEQAVSFRIQTINDVIKGTVELCL